MDFNKKGESAGALDPTEFTVGLYNMCIMTKDLLEDYVFELYDEVHDGNLYQHQVEKMVEESSAHAPDAVKSLVQTVFDSLDKDNDGHISKKEFFQLDSKTESLLRPMYLMQDTLQKRCLGVNFWDEERTRMREMLKLYKEKTILDLLANRVAAKYEAERMKEAAMRGENVEEQKKKEDRARVKKFDTPGKGKGLKFAQDGGAPIYASDLAAKKKEHEAMRKAKLKAKKKKKKLMEGQDGGGEGDSARKKKKKKKSGGDDLSMKVSVKGANKPTAGSSFAMKHREELAVNN